MADFTQNISGTVNFLGPQPSTKFGSKATFGVALFGNGASGSFNMPVRVLTFNNDTGPTFSDSTSANRFITGPFVITATVSMATGGEYLQDGSGRYFEVLAGGATNDENAFVPTYTKEASTSNSWAQATTSTASWVTG